MTNLYHIFDHGTFAEHLVPPQKEIRCSVLEVWETVFDWVSILWGEGTPNDGMRETVWVLGKYPKDAV